MDEMQDTAVEIPVVEDPKGTEKYPDEVEEKFGFWHFVGDVFKKMVLGIFKFVFWKLPCFLLRLLSLVSIKAIFHFVCEFGRALFWAGIWLVLVFGCWMAFGLQHFLNFWHSVGVFLRVQAVVCWAWFCYYKGPIWVSLALMGSVYGLFYISLKKKKAKQEKEESFAQQHGAEAEPAASFVDDAANDEP